MSFRKRIPWGGIKPATGLTVDWNDSASAGLVAFWTLSEGGGLIVKDSARGVNGTLVNAPTWTAGTLGKALRLAAASSQRITATIAATQLISVEMSVDNAYNVNGGLILGNGIGFGLSNGRPYIAFAGVEHVKLSADVIPNRNNNHVCFVYNPSGALCRLYINGVEPAYSSSADRSFSDTTDLSIGSEGASFFFEGIINYVRLYNRRLQQSDAMRLVYDPFAGIVASRIVLMSGAGGGGGAVARKLPLLGVGT